MVLQRRQVGTRHSTFRSPRVLPAVTFRFRGKSCVKAGGTEGHASPDTRHDVRIASHARQVGLQARRVRRLHQERSHRPPRRPVHQLRVARVDVHHWGSLPGMSAMLKPPAPRARAAARVSACLRPPCMSLHAHAHSSRVRVCAGKANQLQAQDPAAEAGQPL